MKLGVHKIHPDAKMPFYATEGSACFDIAVSIESEEECRNLTICPHETEVIGTGLILDIPKGYQVKLYVRSSTGIKRGLTLANGTGIIDSDYTKELMVALHNTNDSQFVHIESGDVLVQGELQPVIQCDFEELEDAPKQKTSRVGGIGSTDVEEYTEQWSWMDNPGVQPVGDDADIEVMFGDEHICTEVKPSSWDWELDNPCPIISWRFAK